MIETGRGRCWGMGHYMYFQGAGEIPCEGKNGQDPATAAFGSQNKTPVTPHHIPGVHSPVAIAVRAARPAATRPQSSTRGKKKKLSENNHTDINLWIRAAHQTEVHTTTRVITNHATGRISRGPPRGSVCYRHSLGAEDWSHKAPPTISIAAASDSGPCPVPALSHCSSKQL